MTETLPANAVRTPFMFSEAIPPLRTMVVSHRGAALGLGHIIARHTLGGKLTGYVVALDCGERITVLPNQIFSAENIIMPSPTRWWRNRTAPWRGPAGVA